MLRLKWSFLLGREGHLLGHGLLLLLLLHLGLLLTKRLHRLLWLLELGLVILVLSIKIKVSLLLIAHIIDIIALILTRGHLVQAELRSGLTTGIEMLCWGLHLLSLLVSHEEREVAPEVLSGLHSLDNFMNGTEQVISEGPDADSSLVRAESKVATVA